MILFALKGFPVCACGGDGLGYAPNTPEQSISQEATPRGIAQGP